jgi:hypothetical protein
VWVATVARTQREGVAMWDAGALTDHAAVGDTEAGTMVQS